GIQAGGWAMAGRGHYAGALLVAHGLVEIPSRFPGFGRPGGDRGGVIPGLWTELIMTLNSSQPAGWDLSPALGRFRGPGDATPQPGAAYRWRSAGPLAFDHPPRATIERNDVLVPRAGGRAALAVFWYSERPGP